MATWSLGLLGPQSYGIESNKRLLPGNDMHQRTDLITNPRNHSTRIAAAILVLLLGISHSSRAGIQQCIGAHSSGQREAKAGHLRQASSLFATCAAMEECPDPIRVECVELHRDVEKNVPSVIFAVADQHGKDLTDVRVFSSDTQLVESLDGRAIQLDPGKYTFRFELPGGESLNEDVVVREGEKNRVVSVRLAERLPVHAQTPPRPTLAVHPVVEQRRGLPTGFWISAGVGAAALASFGTFALLGQGLESKLDQCAPNCDSSRRHDFDAMRRDYLIADISLGLAVVSAGAATWFILSDKSPPRATSERRAYLTAPHVIQALEVVPVVSSTGASVLVNARTF